MKDISDAISLISRLKTELRSMESELYRLAERHEAADTALNSIGDDDCYPVIIGNMPFMVSKVNLSGMISDVLAADAVEYYKRLDQLQAAYEALTNDPS